MKFLPFRGFLLGILTPVLVAQEQPVLTTPGTATWDTEVIAGGWRTVFSINQDTILDWNSLNLPAGSELVYDFLGGQAVLNYLGGTGVNRIDGTVTSNGIVAFFSPQADLVVSGDITAGGVILSTLDADPDSVLSGQGYQMTGSGEGLGLFVRGTVTATSGDILLASEKVAVRHGASLDAAEAVRIAGSSDVQVRASGRRLLGSSSDDGYVLHLGETRAPTIEVVAGGQIQHFGTLDAGNGKIFLEVGRSGRISAGGNAVIVGERAFGDTIQDVDIAGFFGSIEGDAAPVVSDARLKMPALKRPDGSSVTASRTITHSTPMSASGDSSRAVDQRAERVASSDDRKPLLRRSSFFGMRGGSAKTVNKR